MTPDEFAQKIKAKYPQYASMDNATLTAKVVAKYPQYKTQISAPGPSMPFGQKAYNFAQETIPYVAGGLGAVAAAPLDAAAGPLPSIAAGGLGFGAARSGLRALGQKLGYENPQTLGQNMSQTFGTDIPTGMMQEAAPMALKNAMKMAAPTLGRVGRGAAQIAGAATGVDPERFEYAFKNPKTMLPKWAGGPPPIAEAGAAQGAVERNLGVPSLDDKPLDTVYRQRPPKKVSIKTNDWNISELEAIKGELAPKDQEFLSQQLKNAKGATKEVLTDQEMALKVHEGMKKGEMPDVPQAIQALKGVDKSLDVLPDSPALMTKEQKENYVILGRQKQKLQGIIDESVPKLGQSRNAYRAAATRKEFISPAGGILPKTKSDSVANVYRTLGPWALGRAVNHPGLALPFYALQSPLLMGTATAGLGGAAKGISSEAGRRGISVLADILRRRRQLENTNPQ